jgi:FkbM family methyltransferase
MINRFLIVAYRALIATPGLNWIFQKTVASLMPRHLNRFGVELSVHPEDTAISLGLFLGLYEGTDVRFFQQLLRPGLVVVDVGANIGIYTAVAASHIGSDGQVHSFEPLGEAQDNLRRTIQLNSFRNVTVHPCAVSDQPGKAHLSRNLFNRGDNSIFGKGNEVEVTVSTLDAELPDAHVDIIKMDVQGAELHALRGGVQLLKRCQPLVFMELDPEKLLQAKVTPDQIHHFFNDLGYAQAKLPQKISNTLFLPREKAGRMGFPVVG